MKYLCDQMLGTLAKWLRIFGFDTFYANSEMQDSELIDISKKEKRVLVTRDKDLLRRARKEKLRVIEIDSTHIDEQIKKVICQEEIDQTKVLSRCILCNSLLEEIEKEEVEKNVPRRVFDCNEKFWFCPNCKKLYWKGTHYENMIRKVKGFEKSKKAS